MRVRGRGVLHTNCLRRQTDGTCWRRQIHAQLSLPTELNVCPLQTVDILDALASQVSADASCCIFFSMADAELFEECSWRCCGCFPMNYICSSRGSKQQPSRWGVGRRGETPLKPETEISISTEPIDCRFPSVT